MRYIPVSPKQLAELVECIMSGQISNSQGKIVFDVMWEYGMQQLRDNFRPDANLSEVP